MRCIGKDCVESEAERWTIVSSGRPSAGRTLTRQDGLASGQKARRIALRSGKTRREGCVASRRTASSQKRNDGRLCRQVGLRQVGRSRVMKDWRQVRRDDRSLGDREGLRRDRKTSTKAASRLCRQASLTASKPLAGERYAQARTHARLHSTQHRSRSRTPCPPWSHLSFLSTRSAHVRKRSLSLAQLLFARFVLRPNLRVLRVLRVKSDVRILNTLTRANARSSCATPASKSQTPPRTPAR